MCEASVRLRSPSRRHGVAHIGRDSDCVDRVSGTRSALSPIRAFQRFGRREAPSRLRAEHTYEPGIGTPNRFPDITHLRRAHSEPCTVIFESTITRRLARPESLAPGCRVVVLAKRGIPNFIAQLHINLLALAQLIAPKRGHWGVVMVFAQTWRCN